MSTPTGSSILLIGKAELSSAILSSLLSHPAYSHLSTKISIISRSPPSASTPLPEGVSYTQADITATPLDALTNLFNSHSTIIQASGFSFPAGTHLKIAKAALTAPHVRHFIPWQFGVDYDAIGKGSAHKELFDEFLDVRELLRSDQAGDGKKKWTIVSSGLFMSFLFGVREFGVVDFKQGVVVRGLGGWGNKVTLTDVDGIGRMVAEVVFNDDEVERGVVVYIGGETVTYGEIANLLQDILQNRMMMEIKREELGLEEIRARLVEDPDDKMAKYQSVFGEGVGVWWDEERMLNRRLGIRLKGVREWLEENLDGLLKG
ncbi:hypothetical protein QBC44DRAFT_337960 [Cladorrhinum sp. PSN332]|nr:hypothetical protein QBC44DRAFT_337960 [Cladorrhinum sp. PSN332]